MLHRIFWLTVVRHEWKRLLQDDMLERPRTQSELKIASAFSRNSANLHIQKFTR